MEGSRFKESPMVKKIAPKTPEDDDFMHQYSGGVNQYGTKGAEAPDEFQSYMNDGMTTQGPDGTQGAQKANPSGQTPFDMMAQEQNANFGAPAPQGAASQDGAAPENFGPPGIAQTSQGGDGSSFGAPGFGGEASSQNQQQSQGMNINTSPSQSNSSDNQVQVGAPTDTSTGASKGASKGSSGGSSGTSQAKLDPAAVKKKHSKKEVQKMEIDNMMQNAMAHMKVKDPDPQAWQ